MIYMFGMQLMNLLFINTEVKFLVPDRGDIVDKGLSYRSARLNRLMGRYEGSYAIVDYIPQSGTKNLVSVEGGLGSENRIHKINNKKSEKKQDHE
jgi:hypothetical protein